MKILYTILLTITLSSIGAAQKSVHIPNYLQDTNTVDGKQFTWDKTYQSENFILIWGNTVGTDPNSYLDPDLQFNPIAVLDTMEYIYTKFKSLGFMDDAPGTKLSQFKVVIVIYGTWGPNGAQGFANGGDVDGIIGAFWVHPNGIRDGGVAAHEFTHSMQAQNNIDYRASKGLGGAWYNAGIFWETHANFMRNLIYPQAVGAWGMDVYHLETWGDWKNTYENYQLLMALQISEGLDMVARLWRESDSYEYPLQTYKRINNYTQNAFNDSLYHYARRMATYDFELNNLGYYFRQARKNDLNGSLASIQATYSILKKMPGSEGRYAMPIEQAPEEYGYNIIPLYPIEDSCAVIIKFKGYSETNDHAGWRYGFVAENPNGLVSRYSPTYSADESELSFALEGNESKMYLVVMGAPWDIITTNTSNDTWKGYPKHFRFPYELNINGAYPEGFQDASEFRAQLKFNGQLHPNGGGWVENTSNVSPSVYVGSHAIVYGNSTINGNVRIENTSVVRNSTISGNALIQDNAFVSESTISENAKVVGHAQVENVNLSGNALIGMRCKVYNYTLSGSVEVGGDVIVYNEDGNCNNGAHYRLTNYYDNKFLECDGRTAEHPDNKDVNGTVTIFDNAEMALKCNCENLADCNNLTSILDNNEMLITMSPNPASKFVRIQIPMDKAGMQYQITFFNALGQAVISKNMLWNSEFQVDISSQANGIYYVIVGLNGKQLKTMKLNVEN